MFDELILDEYNYFSSVLYDGGDGGDGGGDDDDDVSTGEGYGNDFSDFGGEFEGGGQDNSGVGPGGSTGGGDYGYSGGGDAHGGYDPAEDNPTSVSVDATTGQATSNEGFDPGGEGGFGYDFDSDTTDFEVDRAVFEVGMAKDLGVSPEVTHYGRRGLEALAGPLSGPAWAISKLAQIDLGGELDPNTMAGYGTEGLGGEFNAGGENDGGSPEHESQDYLKPRPGHPQAETPESTPESTTETKKAGPTGSGEGGRTFVPQLVTQAPEEDEDILSYVSASRNPYFETRLHTLLQTG